MKRSRYALLIVGLASLVVACSGSGGGGQDDGGKSNDGTGDGGPNGQQDGGNNPENPSDGGNNPVDAGAAPQDAGNPAIDGGFCAFDLTGGRTHEGHIVQPVYAGALHGSGAVRVGFYDTEGSSAVALQSRAFTFQFPAAVGTYACDGGIFMQYQDGWIPGQADAGSYSLGQWHSAELGSSCTISVTEITPVDGGALKGTFEAHLAPSTGLPKPDAGIVMENGVFDTIY